MYISEVKNVEISIIVPVYNLENYIEKCLVSIGKQTYKLFEIIVIDDGSTDGTLKIVRACAKKDERIKVIHTENKGVSATRQLALENAKGKYIVWVDGDDWIEDGLLVDTYNLCTKQNADAVCYGWCKENKEKMEYNAPTELSVEYVDGKEMIRRFYTGKFHGTLTCYMFARTLFEGFIFPKGISVGCDFAALFYAMQRAEKVVLTEQSYYHYIQRAGSAVHSGYNVGKLNAYYFEKEMKIKALKALPEIQEAIISWYIQNNVFLVSSMCRSQTYNREVIKEISRDIKHEYLKVVKSKYIKLPFKMGAMVLGANRFIYILVYRLVYRFGGSFYTKLTNNVSGKK